MKEVARLTDPENDLCSVSEVDQQIILPTLNARSHTSLMEGE